MKPTFFNEWEQEQCELAYDALVQHAEEHTGHPCHSHDSPEIVWTRLESGELSGAFMAGYLLLFTIGPAWTNNAPLLHEHLLRRCTSKGTFQDAVEGMRAIALGNGCVGIVSGNGVLRDGLRRLYERRGFVKFNEAYFMGV